MSSAYSGMTGSRGYDLTCNILREESDTCTVEKEDPFDFLGNFMEQSDDSIKKPMRIKISANNSREIRFK